MSFHHIHKVVTFLHVRHGDYRRVGGHCQEPQFRVCRRLGRRPDISPSGGGVDASLEDEDDEGSLSIEGATEGA